MDATFHAGELALQRAAGVAERLAQAGPRVIRDRMPEQHRAFFPLLPFLLVGLADAVGQPQVGVVSGAPGFAHSPDPQLLRVDALPVPFDPTAPLLREGAAIGLLGIEPHTRRRNRLNGRIETVDAHGFSVRVGQSFGNCPRYIQARRATFEPASRQRVAVEAAALDAEAVRTLSAADTFFIASAHPQANRDGQPAHGIDVSHRGGRPGFVRVDGQQLTVPDFAGNNYFNTLGNLLLQPRCSLLFIAPDEGDATWVTARARVVQDGPELAAFAGAQRLLQLQVQSFRRVSGGLPLRWGAAVPAPEVAGTGEWRAIA